MSLKIRSLAIVAGSSYVVIFFAAIFANFFALEALKLDPLNTVLQHGGFVRAGIMAFLITVVFDVVVAWALQEMYKSHALSSLSTLFRMMHAAIMGAAVFALPLALNMKTASDILAQVETFNTIWLIGLFFFGIHLLLLGQVFQGPKWIAFMLQIAGVMYMADTTAHFMMANYAQYANVFLAMVALPSILGEMSLAVWLWVKGGKQSSQAQ